MKRSDNRYRVVGKSHMAHPGTDLETFHGGWGGGANSSLNVRLSRLNRII